MPGCCLHRSAQKRSCLQLEALQAFATLRLKDIVQDEVNQFGTSLCNASFTSLLPALVCPKTKSINSAHLCVMPPSPFRQVVAGTGLPKNEVNQLDTLGVMPPLPPGYCRHRSAQRRSGLGRRAVQRVPCGPHPKTNQSILYPLCDPPFAQLLPVPVYPKTK